MVDFSSTESIRAWLAVDKARHLRQLRAMYRLSLFAPFREKMAEAAK